MSDKLGDKVRLQHIIESISKIETYVLAATFEGFESNSMMKDACIRQLGIIALYPHVYVEKSRKALCIKALRNK